MSAKRILVVDDNHDLRASLASLLMSLGYDAREAGDGSEAWSLLKALEVDLIVSDYSMPRLNGFELLNLVRSETRLSSARFVLMSAHTTLSDGRELEGVCAELGVDFVIKGEEPSDLLALIARRLS